MSRDRTGFTVSNSLPSALSYLILPDKMARRISLSTPPISIDDPSGSRSNHYPNTPNVLHVDGVSSCDSRTSYVPCLQLLLTVRAGRVTINILPNDVLLLIFHFNRMLDIYREGVVDQIWRLPWRWHQLTHVCQRWRSVAFASPKVLDLALVCGPSTPMELIGIWPPLPIIIQDEFHSPMLEDYDLDAAIVPPGRVCQIDLTPSCWHWQRLTSVMQEQFPALISLALHSALHDSPLALPDGFLGGSAPCLQFLKLDCVTFPALPKFLLSATALVCLNLWNIPYSGYASPEAIVTGLAVLANLKSLTVEFKYRSYPDQESRLSPPPTRTVLPALTRFQFQGASEYLDGVIARIDVPLLDSFFITFLDQFIFDVSQLAQFTRRTTSFQALNEAHVNCDYGRIQVESIPPIWIPGEYSGLSITCTAMFWQPSNLVQVFISLFPSIYTVEHLYMYGPRYIYEQWQDPMQWLEIFRPFTAVKNLYVIEELARHIAPALQELVGERATDVLPALECLYFEKLQPLGPVQEAIGQIVAARQLVGHPVAVSCWKNTSNFGIIY
jgi:hypothetical protein